MEHTGDERSLIHDDEQLHSLEHGTVPASLLPSVLGHLGLGAMRSLLNTGKDERLAAFGDAEIPVRVAAVRSLGEHGGTTIEPLVAALNDPAWEVRAAAVWALGTRGEQAPHEALMRAAHDADGSVRAAALRTLGLLADHASIEPLVRALDDPDWQVREIAVLTLGERGEQAPLEPLVARLSDEHMAVQEAARMALEQSHPNALTAFSADPIVKPATVSSTQEQEQPWTDSVDEARAKASSDRVSSLTQFTAHVWVLLSRVIKDIVRPLPDARSTFLDDETSSAITDREQERNALRQPARSRARRLRTVAEGALAALIIVGIAVSWLVIAQRLHPSPGSASAPLLAYHGHVDGPAAWSSDSKYISFLADSTATGETVLVWERATGQLAKHMLHTLLANSERTPVFAPDGRYLVLMEADPASGLEVVQVWDILTWHHMFTASLRTLTHAVLWSSDSTRIVIPGDQGVIQVWSTVTGHQLAACRVPTLDYLSASALLSPDGQRVLFGYSLEHTYILDLTTCKLVTLPSSDADYTFWSPQGDRFATISLTDASVVQVWDAQTGRNLESFHLSGSVSTIRWTPDGTRIVISSGKEVEEVDVVTQRIVLKVIPGSTQSHPVWALSPDGTRIATLNGGNAVQLWDAVTGHKLNAYQAQGKGVQVVAWSSDSRSIATGSIDGTVQVWSGNTGLEVFHGDSSLILNVSWSPDGESIVAGGLDGNLWVWQVG